MATYQAQVERVISVSQAAAESVERQAVIRLEGKLVYRAKRRSEVIRVLTGSAWISFDGQDWLLYGGEEISLTPGKDDAVVGSLDGKPLVFVLIGG